MTRDLALVKAALEAAAKLVADELYSELAHLIPNLDPAAIAATVPVEPDKRDAELAALRVRVAEVEEKYAALKETLDPHSIGFSLAVMIVEAEEKADSLRARVAELETAMKGTRNHTST